MSQIPASLHRVLGQDPAAVTAGSLESLLGLEEGQELEFKREVGSERTASTELARDAVAFANASGGLLVIGVTEVDGRASEIVGIERTTREPALRFEQVLGSLTTPRLSFTVSPVEVGGDRDVILIAVEAGPGAPHAVLEKPKQYSYPVRVGRAKDYLSEAQVADAYARRLATADQRDRQLEQLHSTLPVRVPLKHQAWLVMTMVPSRLGLDRLRASTVQDYNRWLWDPDAWPGFPVLEDHHYSVGVGHRSVDIEATMQLSIGRLMMDGSGTVGRSWLTGEGDDGRTLASVMMGELVANATGLLGLLSEHARRRGAGGTASVAVQVVAAGGAQVKLLPPGRRVGRDYDDIRMLEGPTEVSIRSVDLDGLPSDGPALLRAVHLITNDLANLYGHTDVIAITEGGKINGAALNDGWSNQRDWARKWGIEFDSPHP
jgi:hypothetical protein